LDDFIDAARWHTDIAGNFVYITPGLQGLRIHTSISDNASLRQAAKSRARTWPIAATRAGFKQ
jgi:hypothetical protein